jgi:hypothetical protein
LRLTTNTGPVGGSLGYSTTGANAGIPYGFNAERLLLMTGFMVSTRVILLAASRRSVTGRLFGTRG